MLEEHAIEYASGVLLFDLRYLLATLKQLASSDICIGFIVVLMIVVDTRRSLPSTDQPHQLTLCSLLRNEDMNKLVPYFVQILVDGTKWFLITVKTSRNFMPETLFSASKHWQSFQNVSWFQVNVSSVETQGYRQWPRQPGYTSFSKLQYLFL